MAKKKEGLSGWQWLLIIGGGAAAVGIIASVRKGPRTLAPVTQDLPAANTIVPSPPTVRVEPEPVIVDSGKQIVAISNLVAASVEESATLLHQQYLDLEREMGLELGRSFDVARSGG